MTARVVRAAQLVGPDRPLAIREVELADPGPDERRIDLAFAGVNPFDRLNARGLVAPDGPRPRTLGGEASGLLGGAPVLVAGGPAGMGLTRDGTWASAANVPAAAIFPATARTDLQALATMGVAGQTAWQSVHAIAGVGPQDRVVVLGAAGGVGALVAGLCARAGAEVWGQTSRPDRRDAIRAAGAHHVLVGGPEALAGPTPTVAFDALGGPFTGALVEALAPAGRMVSYGTSAGAEATVNMQTVYRKSLTLLGYASMRFAPAARAQALHEVLAALADGTLSVHIDDVLALDAAQAALDRLGARGVVGKLVLDLRA